MKSTRRKALKSMLGTAALGLTIGEACATPNTALKGNIKHSVSRWCFDTIPLEKLCQEVVKMGIQSIELQGPKEWPILKKYGLTCAMPQGAGLGIERGFNDPSLHDELIKSYEAIFPLLKEAGLDKIICFSGNRRGISDEQGIQNCALGLKKLMPSAEKYGITMVMELLNSKVNHKDYQCDSTEWGVKLCQAVGSENFKLLYDIYHMQIMEGDVIATIRKHHKYIAHYHTAGVPGRNEIDETQELYYPAIVRAIIETGYKGFLGQEFVPKGKDPLVSLKQAIDICDV
jgi:hydroxypyruvate isomerase